MKRLTKKKKKEILNAFDQIVMTQRIKIYQQLTPRIDSLNADQIRRLIVQMGVQLVDEVMPMLDEVLYKEPPVLPLKLTD